MCPFRFWAMWRYVLHLSNCFATKINALIGRSAARDIYDVYNMVKHQLFVSDERKRCWEKRPSFIWLLAQAERQRYAYGIYWLSADRTKIRFPQIRSQLLPVLRRSEHFDFEKAKTEVKDFLSKLLVLTESEKEYVREFNDKKYIPELLFEDKKRWSIESNFIQWLCGRQGVVECFFCKFWKKLLFCLVFDSLNCIYSIWTIKQRIGYE